jgi:UrcA family protein
MSTTKLLAALAVTTAIGGVASPSWSQSDSDRVSVHVPVGDLNLATVPGASVALNRIQAAARDICGPEPMPIEINRGDLYRRCMNVTVGTAVASVDLPMLTAVAERRLQPTVLASR